MANHFNFSHGLGFCSSIRGREAPLFLAFRRAGAPGGCAGSQAAPPLVRHRYVLGALRLTQARLCPGPFCSAHWLRGSTSLPTEVRSSPLGPGGRSLNPFCSLCCTI
ncbi:UPF0729 protein C18orf32 homolog isoform X1 [Mustela erminea]|uniref:UPF0729 protein C18orf32 homolog isoform X1 n=1 Tax=Mustela erminea TaxID=36723 RepID=UPI001386C925|nr:UPF0729 protein C18orf32 homolog isoform X1 [Mustela erminea]